MKSYLFTVVLKGYSDNPEDAWLDAVSSLALEPGEAPEYEEEDDDDE